MRYSRILQVGLALSIATIAHLQPSWQVVQAQDSVTYSLPQAMLGVYPSEAFVPTPYKQYYEGITDEKSIELFTKSSLTHDGIMFDSVTVEFDGSKSAYVVAIATSDPNASLYSTVHPKSVDNYISAEIGAARCVNADDCWNKNNTHKDEPWAFLPPLGLPMVMQRSALMLNYPPVDALTKKDYLDNFTMNRWSNVLKAVGIENPTLYEAIVDIRPIAAPGSGTTENLPDAQKYFNNKNEAIGGYYINPQLSLTVDPDPESSSHKNTLPLIVLGTPAREEWNTITGAGEEVLKTGTATIPGASKPTPYILGNHPDLTTYQCCPGDTSSSCDSHDLITDEEVDMQIACWTQAISANPDADPDTTLANCKEKWVTNRSPQDDLTFCAQARIDSNECFGKDIDFATAVNYCKSHDNKPCATYACPTEIPAE